MPKGGRKRTQEEYDKEIEQATRRMKKYPEHLRSARTSDDWKEFLVDIGIFPKIVESKAGGNFWEEVRGNINVDKIGFTERELVEARVTVEQKIFIDERGKFTSKETDRPVISFRSSETGRFVSRKTVENP